MNLSVIIVSYNTRKLLRLCLKSIYENTTGLQFEVIVVDNNSTDGSGEMVSAEFPTVRLLANADNEGFARANNRGFDASQGDNLLFLNSDTIIRNNAITYLSDYLQKHSKVGVVGPKLLTPEGIPTQSYQRFMDIGKVFLGARRLRHIINIDNHRLNYPRYQFTADQEVEWISGAALAIKRNVFQRIGKWDEHYFMYYEDMDLCLQVMRAGYKVMYHPAAEVTHFFGSSTPRTNHFEKVRRKSRHYYFKKNHSTVAYGFVVLLTRLTELQKRLRLG